jgi:hypothetical protein
MLIMQACHMGTAVGKTLMHIAGSDRLLDTVHMVNTSIVLILPPNKLMVTAPDPIALPKLHPLSWNETNHRPWPGDLTNDM